MRNWLARFMYGRYGTDKLNIALIVLWVFCAFINLFFSNWILYILGLLFAVLCLLRMFSRNINGRYRENAVFEKYLNKFTGKNSLWLLRIRQFRTHRFFRCPSCKATVRIPRVTGKRTIRCTRCGHEFQKRILF